MWKITKNPTIKDQHVTIIINLTLIMIVQLTIDLCGENKSGLFHELVVLSVESSK